MHFSIKSGFVPHTHVMLSCILFTARTEVWKVQSEKTTTAERKPEMRKPSASGMKMLQDLAKGVCHIVF